MQTKQHDLLKQAHHYELADLLGKEHVLLVINLNLLSEQHHSSESLQLVIFLCFPQLLKTQKVVFF